MKKMMMMSSMTTLKTNAMMKTKNKFILVDVHWLG